MRDGRKADPRVGRPRAHMRRRARGRRGIYLLLVLGIAALAAATLTFTNVTYWVINATLPPAMKYAGADAGSNPYVRVSYYYDSNTGYNITRVSIVGFTGDPTNYTDVIRICNRYSSSIGAMLRAVGTVGSGKTGLEAYVREFRVYRDSSSYVSFVGSSVQKDTADLGPIGPGQCISLGAYVLVDPKLPREARDGRTVIATYQVNIVMNVQ